MDVPPADGQVAGTSDLIAVDVVVSGYEWVCPGCYMTVREFDWSSLSVPVAICT